MSFQIVHDLWCMEHVLRPVTEGIDKPSMFSVMPSYDTPDIGRFMNTKMSQDAAASIHVVYACSRPMGHDLFVNFSFDTRMVG